MNIYQEFEPGNALQNIVDCYWVSAPTDRQVQYIRPDGCTDLIFNFGDTVSADIQQAGLSPESISAVGMMTECKKVEVSPQSRLVGIRFKTGAIGALTTLPLHKIQDINIDAGELSPTLNKATWAKIADLNSRQQLVSHLDQLLLKMNNNSDNNIDAIAAAAAACIREYAGNIPIKELVKSLNISRRQLERRFRSGIGVSMKSYTCIVRYLHTKSLI
ncbi:DUF6597 domain-containing transcriptional factor [Fodinibius halophilus]|uniref:HTH araC/xylS-type domain-containing protein n=1 Tax=Fodinibius halophilus TaxID=1736908 RepID=A0A6M1TAA0_9BACT|nr:DUF6597 domain-containing transcriptional factor [Fodinibius halophilus]NGP89383.1 hypothetical protein [Fodinibius halophilus]